MNDLDKIREQRRISQKSWRKKNHDRLLIYWKDYRAKNVIRCRGNYKNHYLRIKKDVIDHYSNGDNRCAVCGESRSACLSIDHINGNGASHLRELGLKAGHSFYQWLINNDYPEGYQILCMNCQFIKRAFNQEYRQLETRTISPKTSQI